MGQENGEIKSEDLLKKSSDKGKGIVMYQRKKSRKDARNDIEAMVDFWSSRKNKGICINEEASAAVSLKQKSPPPSLPQTAATAAALAEETPVETTIDWADANSGHLLTCACRVCTGAVPTPLFRSNIMNSSPRRLEDRRPLYTPAAVPVYQFGRFKPPPAPVRKAKVYPSVVIPPSSTQNLQKPHREISLPPPPAAVPKLEDISFIELLASGDDMGQRASISFMDMLQKGDKTLPAGKTAKVAADRNYNLQRFLESSGQMMSTTLESSNNNYFMKMLMEEEGIDDEKLLMEVKQELMIREVDAYACLLRKQNLDFGKLAMTTKNCK